MQQLIEYQTQVTEIKQTSDKLEEIEKKSILPVRIKYCYLMINIVV